MKFKHLILPALIGGGALTYFYYLQTDMTVLMLFLVSMAICFGFVTKSNGWLYGLILSIGIPSLALLASIFNWSFWEIKNNRLRVWQMDYSDVGIALAAIVAAVAATYVGTGIRKMLHVDTEDDSLDNSPTA